MILKRFVCFITTLSLLSGLSFANECGEGRTEKRKAPASFVETTFHGAGMGAYTGFSAGWVRYYAGKYEMQNIWESAGYGALGGLGLGLGAAILGPRGAGDRALTDIERVSGAGGGAGFVWGIVSALFTGDSERIGTAMGWGHLAGFVAGLGLAGYKTAAGKYTNVDEDGKPFIQVRTPAPGRCIVTVTRRF